MADTDTDLDPTARAGYWRSPCRWWGIDMSGLTVAEALEWLADTGLEDGEIAPFEGSEGGIEAFGAVFEHTESGEYVTLHSPAEPYGSYQALWAGPVTVHREALEGGLLDDLMRALAGADRRRARAAERQGQAARDVVSDERWQTLHLERCDAADRAAEIEREAWVLLHASLEVAAD